MKNILMLDDNPSRQAGFRRRFPDDKVVVVEPAADAIRMLAQIQWDVAYLDHDLGGRTLVDSSEPDTGFQVARWLSENPKYIPKRVFLHSLNSVGRANMSRVLPQAEDALFAWMEK